jgi:hypothetical protein
MCTATPFEDHMFRVGKATCARIIRVGSPHSLRIAFEGPLVRLGWSIFGPRRRAALSSHRVRRSNSPRRLAALSLHRVRRSHSLGADGVRRRRRKFRTTKREHEGFTRKQGNPIIKIRCFFFFFATSSTKSGLCDLRTRFEDSAASRRGLCNLRTRCGESAARLRGPKNLVFGLITRKMT